MPEKKPSPSIQSQFDAMALLKKAHEEGTLDISVGERVVELAELIRAGTRPKVRGALEAPAPVAPAIIRPRAEMEMAERIEIGWQNYLGDKGAAAFFGWVSPDGTAKPGDFPLESVTVDRLVRAFPPEALKAVLELMENSPLLTLGPDYGDPVLNRTAMILAMNSTKGGTPQTVDAYVNSVFGSVNPSVLKDRHIRGWRPAIIDGNRNPEPYRHDNPRLPWAERLSARQKFLRDSLPLSGTDLQAYADLMGLSLAEQEPVDTRKLSPWTFTIFEADAALNSSRVPNGFFYDDRPYFHVDGPKLVGEVGRFRSLLRGDVLK